MAAVCSELYLLGENRWWRRPTFLRAAGHEVWEPLAKLAMWDVGWVGC